MELDDSLPLSGLQHLAFCPRQWALIYLEHAWAENRLTAEGRLLHERADLPGQSRRGSLRTVRGLLLESRRLRLTGRADVVEFCPEPFPVEYKRGKRKPTDCDTVQLCAQALCLEEMLAMSVPAGAIFYGEPRRRIDVVFTADPAVGFLHTDRPGRPSLALDLMEELRSALADRLVLTLINRRQVQTSGFTQQDGGGVLLEEVTRKAVVAAWQTRKQEEVEHPFLAERIPIGLVPYTQALLLARHLRGGLDAYPAFLWR